MSALIITEQPNFTLFTRLPVSGEYESIDYGNYGLVEKVDRLALMPDVSHLMYRWINECLQKAFETLGNRTESVFTFQVVDKLPTWFLNGWEVMGASRMSTWLINTTLITPIRLHQCILNSKDGVFVVQFRYNNRIYVMWVAHANIFESAYQTCTFIIRAVKGY